MTDTGQDITVPDEMTIEELETMRTDTQNRFSWSFTQNPYYVETFWVNYKKPRVKDKNGAYELLEHQRKVVRLSQ